MRCYRRNGAYPIKGIDTPRIPELLFGCIRVEMERPRLRELLHDKTKIILTSTQYKTKNARLRELRINTLRVIDAFCVSTGKERR